MPTKKKESAPATRPSGSATPAGEKQSDAYEEALARYIQALDRVTEKDFAGAREMFREAAEMAVNEPELTQRARSYALICERRLAPPKAEPSTIDECYSRAVFLSNAGDWDAAIRLLDRALTEGPGAVRCLYARACALALSGSTDRAVSDLRQAIAIDPMLRFQAINDPDFEKIREEPAFIDIIEPTPTGA